MTLRAASNISNLKSLREGNSLWKIGSDLAVMNWPRKWSCVICKEHHPTGLHSCEWKIRKMRKVASVVKRQKLRRGHFLRTRWIWNNSSPYRCDKHVIFISPGKILCISIHLNLMHKTFAMLDNSSQGCSVKTSLIKTLIIDWYYGLML